jgi:succinate dehydrogenase hydrophobic anchor subunit
MKEWILHRLTSIILIPACLFYPFYPVSGIPYLVIGLYLVLCYHILHGLISIYEDYIQNEVYRNAAIVTTYLSVIFLLKVIVEMVF